VKSVYQTVESETGKRDTGRTNEAMNCTIINYL